MNRHDWRSDGRRFGAKQRNEIPLPIMAVSKSSNALLILLFTSLQAVVNFRHGCPSCLYYTVATGFLEAAHRFFLNPPSPPKSATQYASRFSWHFPPSNLRKMRCTRSFATSRSHMPSLVKCNCRRPTCNLPYSRSAAQLFVNISLFPVCKVLSQTCYGVTTFLRLRNICFFVALLNPSS